MVSEDSLYSNITSRGETVLRPYNHSREIILVYKYTRVITTAHLVDKHSREITLMYKYTREITTAHLVDKHSREITLMYNIQGK